MRRKIILLCAVLVFPAVLSIILLLLRQRDTRDGQKIPFTTNAQANLVSTGDFLYYCDINKNKALCRYNLKTRETQLLFEQAGELKQTITSIYYIVNREVYRITDNSVQKLYTVPDSCFDFIGADGGAIYWISYDNPDSGNLERVSSPAYKLWRASPTDETSPEVLWEQNETGIRDAVYYRERIYMLTDNGIYCTFPDSKKTEKLSDFTADCFVYNEAFLLFRHATDDSTCGYHEITEDHQILQRSAVVGSVATICNETLYYPSAGVLWSVDLSSKERNRKSELQLPGYPWSAIQAASPGVFLRSYLTADIWLYDFETQSFVCILPQQQTK